MVEREREKVDGGEDVFYLPVVDTVTAVVIRVRTTHQRFVCSVRVN